MITIEHLAKKFGDNVVLNDINLHVKAGEVVAIIGPSGSGKSTLLRCLNLLEKPQAGVIQIGDIRLDTSNYNRKQESQLRHQSAMVFQHYNLFRNKTALHNITEALITAQGMSKKQAHDLGMTLLERVGLLPQADQYPITLSGGQQQRVAIARALAVNPKVILFDEPTSALDPERVHEVLHVINRLAKENTTMVIVTHEMEFAKHVADRVVFMADGVIVEDRAAIDLIDAPQHELTKRFLRQLSETIEFEI